MIKHNIRYFAYTIIGVTFLVYAVIFLFTQNLESIDFQKALTHIGTTITINIFIWGGFVKWAWKWKIFYPWLVQAPNLSGKWRGNLKPNGEKGKKEDIPVDVIIEQSFFHIQVKIKTGESSSHSIGASFNIDKERGYQQLFYSYLNTPKSGVRDRSEIHYGSTCLNFEGFSVDTMEGEYWTTRQTTGEIALNKRG